MSLGQTQGTNVWGPQQQYLQGLYGQAQNLFGQPTAANPAAGLATQIYGQGAPQVSTQGLDLTSQYATGGAQNLTNQAQQAFGQALTADPTQSPYFQNAVSAATRPMVEQFTQNVIPQLRSGAVQGGTFGGSRRGLAEGMAATNLGRQIGDVASQMGQQAYGQGLQARTQALGLAPQIQGLGFAPGQELQRAQAAQQGLQMGGLQQQWAPLQQYMQSLGAEQGLGAGAIQNQWLPLQNYAGIIGGPVTTGGGGWNVGLSMGGNPSSGAWSIGG